MVNKTGKISRSLSVKNYYLLELMYATHAALDCMQAQDGGDINIALIAVHVSGANFGVYCASKFGVIAFTETLLAKS